MKIFGFEIKPEIDQPLYYVHLAILATVVLVAINPARQFKLTRDSQRTANVTAILNAIGQNMADHRGIFTCASEVHELPLTPTVIQSGGGAADIAECLVPTYIASLPFDPSSSNAHYISNDDYQTKYSVSADSMGRVSVTAVSEIEGNSISVMR